MEHASVSLRKRLPMAEGGSAYEVQNRHLDRGYPTLSRRGRMSLKYLK